MCKLGLFNEYKGFTSSINYSYSDNLYYGELLEIEDTITFHSTNVIKLYERFKEAVDNYLESKNTTL